MTYTSTPGPTKDLWWTEFKRAFTWDPSHEMEIKRIFKKKCGDHIRHTIHHAKISNKKPPCITDENWTRIKGVWDTEESKQRSHQNRTNQSYNSGDSSATYAGGSINIEEHTRRLTKEMGKEPSVIETFTRTFQKKDKTWSGDRARAMKEKFDEVELAQRSSSASDNADGSEPSIGNDLSIWLEVTGGSKGGRILGMGSLSRTHRVAGTSSSSSSTPAMRAQINSLTEEVSQLKGIIIQRDEEMREMRRQQNEEMNEMRRQQQMIMQHFQLGSAPSQLPPVPHDDDDGDDGEDDSS
ncbi:uncharacterized protein LOC141812212 [Curcuma longa]|uniref:uncharacterized protein LOC141812212 n=1 Tax=Curcuma longa TaxID=136217 RepID=UPI003D9E3444